MLKTNYNQSQPSYPVLALAIHNGHDLSTELSSICGISEADRLREEDPYTGEIAQRFTNNIIVHSSRFMVDLNRSPEKAVYQNPEDCWGLPVRKNPIPEEYLAYLKASYDAWYEVLRQIITDFLARHPLLVVFDIHSYNHRRGGPDAIPDPQSQNPDIIIGRSNMPAAFHPLVSKLTSLLNGARVNRTEIDCREDVKFSGGHLSRWLHSNFPGRVLCLAIEFKKIFMNEWTGELNSSKLANMSVLFKNAVDAWLIGEMGIFPGD